jgi:hypothetical protein
MQRAQEQERQKLKKDMQEAIDRLARIQDEQLSKLKQDYERKINFRERHYEETLERLEKANQELRIQGENERYNARQAYSAFQLAEEKFLNFQSRGEYLLERLARFKQGILAECVRMEAEMKDMQDSFAKEARRQVEAVQRIGSSIVDVEPNLTVVKKKGKSK